MRWLPLTFVSLLTGCMHLAGPPLPERKTRQIDQFVLEYSIGDEAYADILTAQLQQRIALPLRDAPQPLTLTDLKRRRDYFLKHVAGFIGLEAPTKEMADKMRAIEVQPFEPLPASALFCSPNLIYVNEDRLLVDGSPYVLVRAKE